METNYDESFGGYYCRAPWAITTKYGLEASVLYGLIWFRSNLEKGYCCESYSKMGEILNISISTVKRRIRILKNANLIKDIKPDKSKKKGDTRWFIVIPEQLHLLETEQKYLEENPVVETSVTVNLVEDDLKLQKTMDRSNRTGVGSNRTISRATETLGGVQKEPESNKESINSNKEINTDYSFFSISQLRDTIRKSILLVKGNDIETEFYNFIDPFDFDYYPDCEDIAQLKLCAQTCENFLQSNNILHPINNRMGISLLDNEKI